MDLGGPRGMANKAQGEGRREGRNARDRPNKVPREGPKKGPAEEPTKGPRKKPNKLPREWPNKSPKLGRHKSVLCAGFSMCDVQSLVCVMHSLCLVCAMFSL